MNTERICFERKKEMEKKTTKFLAIFLMDELHYALFNVLYIFCENAILSVEHLARSVLCLGIKQFV